MEPPRHHVTDRISFALRHEWFDPLVLKRVFDAVDPATISTFVRDTLTGTAVDALDPERYATGNAALSKRHRVRNNLRGTGGYCPVIRRTEALEDHRERRLADKAAETVGRTSGQLISRAASFLLLADSCASFAIEGARAAQTA